MSKAEQEAEFRRSNFGGGGAAGKGNVGRRVYGLTPGIRMANPSMLPPLDMQLTGLTQSQSQILASASDSTVHMDDANYSGESQFSQFGDGPQYDTSVTGTLAAGTGGGEGTRRRKRKKKNKKSDCCE